MRRSFCFLLIILAAAAAAGCAPDITVTAMSGQSYQIVSCTFASEYADRVPEEGWEFLLISLRGTEDDLDNIQATFYGPESKAAVSDGKTHAECQLVVYAAGANGIADAVLLFAVPKTFATDFELYGPAFESVALSAQRPETSKQQ